MSCDSPGAVHCFVALCLLAGSGLRPGTAPCLAAGFGAMSSLQRTDIDRSKLETQMPVNTKFRQMANAIRFLSADAVQQANSGHPGLPMGAADIATVLFGKVMNFDIQEPQWPDRDRFVLSAGHGSMLLYAVQYLLGSETVTLEQIRNFRQLGSLAAGHPEYHPAAGIETTTGPLGQGLANAVGMAIAERKMNAEFGDALVDHRTYVLAGDGCLMEGISQEAVSLAGHLQLHRLVVIWDNNGITIDGAVSKADSTDQIRRFAACGWNTSVIDGHDHNAISEALDAAGKSGRPTLIAAKTVIGFGAPGKEGSAAVHGAPLGAETLSAARERLEWPHPPFVVPSGICDAWRLAGLRGAVRRREWEKRLENASADIHSEFKRRISGALPSGLEAAFDEARKGICAGEAGSVATRKSSQTALELVNARIPETIGGSADLTGSNNTRTKGLEELKAGDFTGRYVNWGVREHIMAAAMNGIALHGGLIPYGGTFLVFSDYCRPAIRLAAMMKIRVIFVLTHDSIGLGEDGPTHQPVEHLAALRAIPGLRVYRPADSVEVMECWQDALAATGPSVLALTRQGLPRLRDVHMTANQSALGAYNLAGGDIEAPPVTIFASGSEVQIGRQALDILAAENIAARLVSVPCLDRFAEMSAEYRAAIIGDSPVKIAVEAGIRQGWGELIGPSGGFVGMAGFGASAPCGILFEHFGMTAQNVAEMARTMHNAGAQ